MRMFQLQEVEQEVLKEVETLECDVAKGEKTSDFYRTKDIPNRFENPGIVIQSFD